MRLFASELPNGMFGKSRVLWKLVPFNGGYEMVARYRKVSLA